MMLTKFKILFLLEYNMTLKGIFFGVFLSIYTFY